MRYLSQTDYETRLKKIKRKNASKERKAKLKVEKKKIKSKSKVETSKLFAFYLFVVFNIILVYALVAMWMYRDLTYLGVLITDIAAQAVTYGIYCLKAYHGKKQEEQIKFEKEKLYGMNESNEGNEELDFEEAVG